MLESLATEFQPSFGTLPPLIAALRMLAALLMGGAIGWEREMHTKPAGLRTHMMVALAACLFTILALDLVVLETSAPMQVEADPISLVQAITAGVAFLAAGTIITARGHVRGLTTGAGLWLAGAIGLACGLGELALAGLATLLALAVLWIIRRLEDRIGTRDDDEI